MSFTTLRSQQRVKTILEGIVRHGRVSNGYLFVGPEQCGKTTAAREFFNLLAGKPVGDKSVDLYQINPENTIKIETIRELKTHVQYGPRELPYLMVLIQHAERFTMEAANSFLKLLEEPPVNVFFILETAQADAVLKTIHSRCQKIVFDQLSASDCAAILGPESDPAILAMAGGLLPAARMITESRGAIEEFLAFLAQIKSKTVVELSAYADRLCTSREQACAYLQLGLQYFRQQEKIPAALVIHRYLKIMQKNVNLKLTCEVLFMKLRAV
jgi:hypothetical protein